MVSIVDVDEPAIDTPEMRDSLTVESRVRWAGQPLVVQVHGSSAFFADCLDNSQQYRADDGQAQAGAKTKTTAETSDNAEAVPMPTMTMTMRHLAPKGKGTVELQVLTWGQAALDVVVGSKSSVQPSADGAPTAQHDTALPPAPPAGEGSDTPEAGFVPRWKAVAWLPIESGELVQEDDPADSRYSDATFEGVAKPKMSPEQLFGEDTATVDSEQHNDEDDSEAQDGDTPTQHSMGLVDNSGPLPASSQQPLPPRKAHACATYRFAGSSAPPGTGLYRCVYVVHRPTKAGSAILQRATSESGSTSTTAAGGSPAPPPAGTSTSVNHSSSTSTSTSTTTPTGGGQATGTATADAAKVTQYGRYIIARSEIVKVRSPRCCATIVRRCG